MVGVGQGTGENEPRFEFEPAAPSPIPQHGKALGNATMFDEMPNPRITRRRKSLRDALVALTGVAGGVTAAMQKGHLDWETLGWGLLLILGVYGYWSGRHEDPWNPPLKESAAAPVNELKIEGKN
jgi:hypothetical protein